MEPPPLVDAIGCVCSGADRGAGGAAGVTGLDTRRARGGTFGFGGAFVFGDFAVATADGGDEAMAVGVGVLATGVDAECIGAGEGVDIAPCEGLPPLLAGGG